MEGFHFRLWDRGCGRGPQAEGSEAGSLQALVGAIAGCFAMSVIIERGPYPERVARRLRRIQQRKNQIGIGAAKRANPHRQANARQALRDIEEEAPRDNRGRIQYAEMLDEWGARMDVKLMMIMSLKSKKPCQWECFLSGWGLDVTATAGRQGEAKRQASKLLWDKLCADLL